MRASLWLLLIPLQLIAHLASAQSDSPGLREVLEVEDRRFAAMVRADTASLGQLLAPDLTYTHTSGRLDTRQALLQSIGAGTLRYAGIAPDDRAVRLYGNTAVVVGRSTMRVGSAAQLQTFRIRYLAIYVSRSSGWQLLAWQATRLPE